MVVQIVWIFLVATIFYLALPIISSIFLQTRWKSLLSYVQTTIKNKNSYTDAQFVSMQGNMLIARLKNKEEETTTINPKKTIFYSLTKNKNLGTYIFSKIVWSDIHKLAYGLNLLLLQYKKKSSLTKEKIICIFTETTSISETVTQLEQANPDPNYAQITKPFWVAIGVLLEFFLFVHNLYFDGHNLVTTLALIAIFGKIVPYLPPGLFLAIVANTLHNNGKETKKNKTIDSVPQQQTKRKNSISYILLGLGILINISILLGILHLTGISLF